MTHSTDDAVAKAVQSAGDRLDGDPRFTLGVYLDVARALEAHGYGPFSGHQLLDLGQHLFHFLHGETGQCLGRAAADVEAPVPEGSNPLDRAVAEHLTEVARTVRALRRSTTAYDRAVARYDERWGVEL